MMVDTHAHLQSEEFKDDWPAVVEKARAADVRVILTVGTSVASSREALRIAESEEGIFAGISAGAILWAAMQVAARPEFEGKTVVSIAPDFGERYLSNPVYAELPAAEAAVVPA